MFSKRLVSISRDHGVRSVSFIYRHTPDLQFVSQIHGSVLALQAIDFIAIADKRPVPVEIQHPTLLGPDLHGHTIGKTFMVSFGRTETSNSIGDSRVQLK